MKTTKKTWFFLAAAASLALAAPGFAQQQPAGGWRKVGNAQSVEAVPPPDAQGQGAPDDQGQGAPPPNYQQGPPPGYQQRQPAYPTNGQIRVAAGTWVTVRINQPISTDHNQTGDAFTATLAQPIVAEGRVIARSGQMVAGRVADVQKGGRVKGTSSLSIELTELSLVDGQQIPIRTQLTDRRGGTSNGRDAGAIAATTGVGAAIGAGVDGGFGAGMGAIGGAVVSTIGVLVTRGNSTTVYPEQMLTFRIEQPFTISTANSEQAFQPVSQEAYDRGANYAYRDTAPAQRPAPYYGNYYSYAPYGYYPTYYGYGYGYGPSFYFSTGPRFYRGYGGYGYRGGGGYRHR